MITRARVTATLLVGGFAVLGVATQAPEQGASPGAPPTVAPVAPAPAPPAPPPGPATLTLGQPFAVTLADSERRVLRMSIPQAMRIRVRLDSGGRTPVNVIPLICPRAPCVTDNALPFDPAAEGFQFDIPSAGSYEIEIRQMGDTACANGLPLFCVAAGDTTHVTVSTVE